MAEPKRNDPAPVSPQPAAGGIAARALGAHLALPDVAQDALWVAFLRRAVAGQDQRRHVLGRAEALGEADERARQPAGIQQQETAHADNHRGHSPLPRCTVDLRCCPGRPLQQARVLLAQPVACADHSGAAAVPGGERQRAAERSEVPPVRRQRRGGEPRGALAPPGVQDGDRGAVVVIPQGFGDGLAASHAGIEVYYDNSNLIRIGYVTSTVEATVQAFNEKVAGAPAAVSINAAAIDTQTVRFIDFLAPGMVGMTIMFTNLAVGFLLVNWREMGILRRLGVTPLRPGVLLWRRRRIDSICWIIRWRYAVNQESRENSSSSFQKTACSPYFLRRA